MSNMNLKGVELVDGTKDGFSLDSLTNKGKIYFVRTDAEGENGYIYFNGKKYGEVTSLNAGEY